MARFHFDVRDGESVTRDDTGLEFPGLQQARDEASRAAAEIITDTLPAGPKREVAIEVRDENGKPLFKARVAFAIEPMASEWPTGIRRRLTR
jgi:hypothetical protein